MDSEERDNVNNSDLDGTLHNTSLNMQNQTSDKKTHKRLYMNQPKVIDVAET